jgi:glycosyltransferase involved in cell wall biosynthesis
VREGASPVTPPRFTVVVPTRDRAALLPVALDSVVAQTDRDWELVVVDDGSSDGTATVVASYRDTGAPITYVRREGGGVSAARNAGVAAANGEYLVFLDDDDELLPGALGALRAAIDARQGALVLGGWVQVSADRRTWRTRVPRATESNFRGAFLPGAFALRTDVFRATGGYDEQLRFGENSALAWRVRAHLDRSGERVDAVGEPLCIRYDRAQRSYELAKYESARRVIEGHGDVLASEAAGSASPRRRRATYLAIAGVSAARLGRRREAWSYALAALRTDPSSPARYRNLATVARFTLRPPRNTATSVDAGAAPAAQTPVAVRGDVHAIVVTFERAASLARILEALGDADVVSVTVVDNAPSDATRRVVRDARDGGRVARVDHVEMPENTGPAGGFAAGMTHVLGFAADRDWMLVLDDDRLTAPPATIGTLRDFGEWLVARGTPVGAVGQVGSRFDRRRGRLVRPADDELVGPLTVDAIAGGQLLTVRCRAARVAGGFDPALFFGFEELEFALRLAAHGFGLYVDGAIALDARRRFGRLGAVTPVARRESAWRRYYAVRNHVVVMRRYASSWAAVLASLGHAFARPLVDVRKRRRDWRALTVASWRGCIDAWAGRTGRRVEPVATAATSDADAA